MNGWKIGSLFSGIGGLERGLESAGLGRTAVQVEQDDFALGILERHWPEAKRYRDVREVGAAELGGVEVLCGGFPCQDISKAGKGAGIDGERSGLWSEYARIIGEVGPEIVVVENVPMLVRRGIDRVLGDLASLGYDAEWDCIPAAAVGAPHQRDRVFIVAYPHGSRYVRGESRIFPTEARFPAQRQPVSGGPLVADPVCAGPQGGGDGWPVADQGEGPGRLWPPEPNVGRVAYGVPDRVDRLRCLGNAVVPEVGRYVGGLIVKALQPCIEVEREG